MVKQRVYNIIEKRINQVKFDNAFAKNIKIIKDLNSCIGCLVNELKLDINMTEYSSYIDYIIESESGDVIENKELSNIKNLIINKIKEITLEFKKNSLNINSYIVNIKKFASINRKPYDREIFSDIYIDDEVSEEMVNNLIDYFNVAITLINPKLLEKISNITLLIKVDDEGEEQYFSNLEQNVISLTISEDTNLFNLLTILVHEVIHLIEFHNQEVNDLAHSFIKERAVSVNKAEMRRGRPSLNWKDVLAYDLKTDDPHSGYVYENKLTEVLTTGVQKFLLAPALTLFKDVDYAEVLYKFFKM